MLTHLLKIVWNRKRVNALIILEISISFLVIFALSAVATRFLLAARHPLGYDWRSTLDVVMTPPGSGDFDEGETVPDLIERLRREAMALDGVEHAAISMAPLFSTSGSRRGWTDDHGRTLLSEVVIVSPEYDEVFGVELVAGRWFEAEDLHKPWLPVVINRRLAEEAFGDDDPIGKVLDPRGEAAEARVVGVFSEFRKAGHLSAPDNLFFTPMWPEEVMRFRIRRLSLRLAPSLLGSDGTARHLPLGFEENLVRTLREVAPGWSFDVRPLAEQRRAYLRRHLAPLLAAGVVAGFLMIMVALGLFGVLWQNVTQRTRELGLRRANGATARDVFRQILGELVVLASLGVGIGLVVVAQLPIVGVASLDAGLVIRAALAAAASIYLLTILCGFYPSWLATRVRPAEALHYE